MKFNLLNLTPFVLRTSFLTVFSIPSLLIQGQQIVKRPTPTINQYFSEVQTQGSYAPGIKAFCFEEMRYAFPKSSYTDILADLEELLTTSNVQDRFLYILYRGYTFDQLQYTLYAISKDASKAKILTNYCIKRFNKPDKLIQDLKLTYDKAEAKDLAEKQKLEVNKGRQTQDSLNKVQNKLVGTKQNLTLSELIDFDNKTGQNVEKIKDFMKTHSSITWEVEAEANDPNIEIRTDLSDDQINYDPTTHYVELELSDDDYWAQLQHEIKQDQSFSKIATYKPSMDILSKVIYKSSDYQITFLQNQSGSMGVNNFIVAIIRISK